MTWRRSAHSGFGGRPVGMVVQDDGWIGLSILRPDNPLALCRSSDRVIDGHFTHRHNQQYVSR